MRNATTKKILSQKFMIGFTEDANYTSFYDGFLSSYFLMKFRWSIDQNTLREEKWFQFRRWPK